MVYSKLNIIAENLLAKGKKDLANEIYDIISEATKDKIRLVVFSASPRNKKTCPGQSGKTADIAKQAAKSLPKHIKVDFVDLSVKGDGVIVQPCKGCVSTAGGYHCHWKCTCYGPGSAGEKLNDLMFGAKIYDKLEKADGFALFTPINWYSVPTQVKAMFDRLVCASETLTKHQAYDILQIGKDPKKSRACAKSGEYDHWLKNHLAGKYAAFFIHGDDGANDFEHAGPPESYSEKEERPHNGHVEAVMPIVSQCKYSGIHVPDDLIFGAHINEGLDYATANDVYDENKKLFDEAKKLLNKLVKHIEKSK
jgi:multimeric flavodoxin WrbA